MNPPNSTNKKFELFGDIFFGVNDPFTNQPLRFFTK